jgi:hypothetical protein
MNDELGLPDFDHLGVQLTPMDPAEIHGLLCGLLCVTQDPDDAAWLERIIDDLPPAALNWDARQELSILYHVTLSQLRADDFRFALCLPDDGAPLPRRLAAFRRWCQHFLSGLGAGGLDKRWPLSADARGFLNDVFAIAQSGGDDTEAAGEDSEQDYSELVEYVRMGVLLVHEELPAVPARRTPWH